MMPRAANIAMGTAAFHLIEISLKLITLSWYYPNKFMIA
jgi:hypothetical protein